MKYYLSDGLNEVIIRIIEIFRDERAKRLPIKTLQNSLLGEFTVPEFVDEGIRLADVMDFISIIKDENETWCYFPGLGKDDE
ncbi:MAG: hypothetical protein ACW99U_15060 [Candidatus Thorarchaeota archaeon]|jgi:hypothetical protein